MESYNKSYDAIYDSHSLLFEQYTADLSLANTSNLVYINQESTEQQKPCQNTAHSNSTMFSYFLATVSFLLVIAWNTRFRGNLRFIYNYTSFIIYLAGFGASFMLLVGLLRPRNPRNVSVAVRLLRFAERFLSFRVTSLGAQNIPKDDSFILICNHQRFVTFSLKANHTYSEFWHPKAAHPWFINEPSSHLNRWHIVMSTNFFVIDGKSFL